LVNLTTVHDGFRSWNNAYCQDNELTWFDWARADRGLLEFTRRADGRRTGRCSSTTTSWCW
jgi:pullulanase/glycogen debranching enzyme